MREHGTHLWVVRHWWCSFSCRITMWERLSLSYSRKNVWCTCFKEQKTSELLMLRSRNLERKDGLHGLWISLHLTLTFRSIRNHNCIQLQATINIVTSSIHHSSPSNEEKLGTILFTFEQIVIETENYWIHCAHTDDPKWSVWICVPLCVYA